MMIEDRRPAEGLAIAVPGALMAFVGRGKLKILHHESPDRRSQARPVPPPLVDPGAYRMDRQALAGADALQRFPHLRLKPQTGTMSRYGNVAADQRAFAGEAGRHVAFPMIPNEVSVAAGRTAPERRGLGSVAKVCTGTISKVLAFGYAFPSISLRNVSRGLL